MALLRRACRCIRATDIDFLESKSELLESPYIHSPYWADEFCRHVEYRSVPAVLDCRSSGFVFLKSFQDWDQMERKVTPPHCESLDIKSWQDGYTNSMVRMVEMKPSIFPCLVS